MCHLAFRGHRQKSDANDNQSRNFVNIIELLVRHGLVMSALQKKLINMKYFNPKVQNELIAIPAKQIHNSCIVAFHYTTEKQTDYVIEKVKMNGIPKALSVQL